MEEKKSLYHLLEQSKEELFALGDALFQVPELGFKEVETGRLAGEFLEAHGIPCEKGVPVTGIRATLGSGGYHIALMADMDAILVGGDGGEPTVIHSCGHSLQVAAMLGVMRSIKESGLLERFPGRVTLFLTPAEEYIDLDYRETLIREGKIRYASGKQNLIADGALDDVDCVLSCHIMGRQDARFDVNSTLAGFSVKQARFLGEAAHSGVAPHLGRNALHAATLCIQACSYLLEQFPPEAGARLHPILTRGGVSMNAIPDTAVLETYLRANDMANLSALQDKFDAAVRHCAGAVGVEAEIRDTVGYLPLAQPKALCDVVFHNMLSWCGNEEIVRGSVSGASGDIGDVASILPSIQFGFSGIRGRVHSSEFQIADRERAYLDPARITLGTIADLLMKPELQIRNPHYREDKERYLREWLHQEG